MRYALMVEYDGTDYYGFQTQYNPALPTIQDELEKAIGIVADHKVNVYPAGRTDAGVHSLGQIIHFDTTALREEYNWILGINHNLPKDISIKKIKLVPDNFHARFSALSREYHYRIYNHFARSAINANKVAHYYFAKLDAEKMNEASKTLLGEHDFSAFRAISCQSKTPFRCVQEIKVHRENDEVILHIRANAFLHHMVRNIVGVLLDIGSGKKPISYAKEILESKDRTLSSATAHACGLYFIHVEYSAEFGLLF